MASFLALIRNDPTSAGEALRASADVGEARVRMLLNVLDPHSFNALHCAAQAGLAGLVSQILATNALDIQAVTQQGFSALYLAAKANHADVVRVLLAGGADPNLKDGHGQTALHRACEDSFEAVAADLIAHTKTDLDAADLMGRTPLHWACSRGPVRLVSQLLERGANLLKTKGGETAVHWATRSGNDDIVALLLKHFPFVNVYDRNERGESSIDLSQGNDNIRGLLLAHADSLGYSDKSSGTQINTQEQIATMVKPIAPSNPKGKKITIKMKPPTK